MRRCRPSETTTSWWDRYKSPIIVVAIGYATTVGIVAAIVGLIIVGDRLL
jgi:hypothetical protein